jgi:hypothetical protein
MVECALRCDTMSLWDFTDVAKIWRPVGLRTFFVATLVSSPAFADKIEYAAIADSVPHLVIRSNETESDAFIRATCPQTGMVELRLGAEFEVGSGNGAAVSLTLKSAGKTANISGVSLQSIDSPMTGGSELLATIPSADPIFAVLSSGASIRLSGSIKGAQSLSIGNEATKSLKKFLASCKA